MYTQAVVEGFREHCELVGLCDSNAGRLQLRRKEVRAKGSEVPGYGAEDFDRMIRETKPECVIVTTKDCHHDEYLCRAMELGCDAITEKPMTTDEVKCRRILETQRRTGRKVTVTFNYRYAPPRTQVKDLLMSGVIGNVFSVDFHWLLDIHHGADYFRRWHRRKENSGGLLVHKATHHFDLVNWWLSSVPVSVYAVGKRNFYTPKTAERYGLTRRAERCLDCPETARCPFHLDMRGNQGLRELYLETEKYDGYFRDRCVFSGEIDIEDTMQLVVAYAGGAAMSYSLHAFMPWEGYTVCFNGTRGRLEHVCQETVYISGDGSVPGELKKEGTTIKVFPHNQSPYAVEVWKAKGGHGGGDGRLVDAVFNPKTPPDKHLRAADQRAGAYSILTGIAANHSLAGGRPVKIADLVPNLAMPDYPPMPGPEESLPLPPKWVFKKKAPPEKKPEPAKA
jgi:predicted dehydrogenase